MEDDGGCQEPAGRPFTRATEFNQYADNAKVLLPWADEEEKGAGRQGFS